MTRDQDRQHDPSPTSGSGTRSPDAAAGPAGGAPGDDAADDARVDPVRSPERRRIQALARTYREQFRHRHVTED